MSGLRDAGAANMDEPAFPMIKVRAERSMAKPRRTGLTMMIDWGLPLAQQADYLDMSGRFIDLAKIAVGSVRVYGEQQLRAKIALYKDHGVRRFVGGGIVERLFALDGPG